MWDELELPDLQLLMAFFRSFSKQAPEVVNHYIAEDGTAYIGSGNLANATTQLTEQYEQSLIAAVKKNNTLFRKISQQDVKGWAVVKSELHKFNLNNDQGKLAFLKALGMDVKFNILAPDQKNIVSNC